ncbi:MAG: DNA alkylation repair protein [Rickettsiales bacterium]|jgi:3-methyladenine DNA glycosylase AlkD|nr:DNA alkylation repair protein [Rickettsiales bacterium]
MRKRKGDGIAPTVESVMAALRGKGSATHREHAARVGISAVESFGVSTAEVRRMARAIGRNHPLALDLWKTSAHEARLMAVLIADPLQMDTASLDAWLEDIGSWDLCDHFCTALACTSPQAEGLVFRWAADSRLYVRRAALATIACLAVHRDDLDPDTFTRFLETIRRLAEDDRPHVRKAASWALRELGKRDFQSHDLAVGCATDMTEDGSRGARWVAKDALRELQTLVAVPQRRRLLTSKSKMGAKQVECGS